MSDRNVIDAEFTVVTPKRRKRPAGTEHWTEAQFESWLKQPWWNRWETDWPRVAIIAAIALAGLVHALTGQP